MKYLNLASIRQCTEVEGPGKRFAIWVQGCNRRCPGCCNEQMQEIKPVNIVSVEDVIKIINKAKIEYKIEGITLLGGEPFLQAKGLSEIAIWAKENNLTVLIFTGFLLEELKKINDIFIDKLLEKTDVLVDGPFCEEQYDLERDWVGSKNQRVLFLTDAYKAGIEFQNNERKMEILVSKNTIAINGWPFNE